MSITIAICTWNRCQLLRQTLEQMRKLVIPRGTQWELLVVNNNCTDATDDVIASFLDRLPIRRLFEPRPGKSSALNLAVRQARGDYILWTDDDVLVDDRWIIEYSKAFRRWPNASLFGGPARPWFAGTPPRWLMEVLPKIRPAYAIRDLGDKPIRLTHSVYPYGVNFAVKTKDQAQYLYDVNLGPRPNSNFRGEERAVIRKMLAEGKEGWWVPKACVHHYISQDRQTTRHVRFFFMGLGEELGLLMSKDGFPKLFGKPRWLWRQAIEYEFRYCFRRVLCKPELWIEDLRMSSIARGQLRGFVSGSSD